MGKIIYNNREIKRIYNGTREVFNICQGDTQIWQNFNGVDLGLPSGTLWADRNLGAISANDYGKEYSWGYINDTATDDWDNYMCSAENCGDEENDPLVIAGAIYKDQDNEWFGDISSREFDITINQGNDEWRLPTSEEVDELISYCTKSKVVKTINNTNVVIGIKLTGLNDNYIFLPILDQEDNKINEANCNDDSIKHGYYWTGTINSGNVKQAYSFVFSSTSTGTPSIGMCISSRFRHLAIRPVKKDRILDPTIIFANPETDTKITAVSLYEGESKSLYFKISPNFTSIKKVNFSSSNENIVTVTNTGYITAIAPGSATITAKLPNNEIATCDVTVEGQTEINKIILNDKNNQPIAESSTNTISITLNEWESMWIIPSLINADNTSEGIIDKRLKWQITSGTDKVFIVPLHNMGIYWENTAPIDYDCHPIKIFGLSHGTAKITITSNVNPTKKAYINVIVNENTNKCNGHTYVDLGIPGAKYWSTENIGATNYNDVGGYYAWGESITKDFEVNTNNGYSLNNYSNKLAGGVIEFLGQEIYNTQYDTAKNIWGGHWRMPNYQEFNLLTSLNDAGIKINGINYILKMGFNNDNFILIPKNGYKSTNTVKNDPTKYNTNTPDECLYWSSTCTLNTQPSNNNNLKVVYVYNTGYGFINYVRCKTEIYNGIGVRAIYVFEAPYITYIGYENNLYKYAISHDDLDILSDSSDSSDIDNSNIKIYYTIDGSDPKTNGVEYKGIITSSTNITIRAVAKDAENNFSKESTNEPTYIDLGLPSGIKWCTHNIGSTTFDQVGDFYKLNFNSTPSINNNIIYVNNEIAPRKSYGSFMGNQNCDPATILNNDPNYCTPTHEHFQELVENCSFIYTKININGIDTFIYKVVGPNGNYIYLPFGATKTTSTNSSIGNSTGESTSIITLMISDYVHTTNQDITGNGYVKFAKSFRSKDIDGSTLWHNLHTIARVTSDENEFHIRPIYIGDAIQSTRKNAPKIKNINIDNDSVYSYNYFPINDDAIPRGPVALSSLNDSIYNAWSQMFPSGITAPKYKFNGGSHYGVGGCMAMHGCQIMWYHKWPIVREYKNAKNTFDYIWNNFISSTNSPIFKDSTGKIFPITLREKDKNKTYTVSRKRTYHYNDMLANYFTCPYQKISTNTNSILAYYESDARIGKQYNYTQAVEYGNFLLEFGQLMYSSSAGVTSLKYGPYETVGYPPADFQSMQHYFNYDTKKQFSLSRTAVNRSLFEEIIQESLNSYMPVGADSSRHAWMISGYDTSTGKYYINMNEGDANKLLQDIDNIHDTTKKYSYIYAKTVNGYTTTYLEVSASTQVGISPICTKHMKDYFFMYMSSMSKTDPNTSTTKTVAGYCRYIKKWTNGTDSTYNKYNTTISFGKEDIFILYTSAMTPKGNAIPERIYVAVCLENINNPNNNPIILKKIWYTPIYKSGYSNGGGTSITISDKENMNFSKVSNGTYYLTVRYSKDDGKTYSERGVVPDVYEREILTVEVTNTTVTITPTYKNYGENYM